MSTILTGSGVTLFQYAAAKQALKLEKNGIKIRAGRSIRKTWAVQLGLKANAKYDEVIAALDKKIDEIKANLKPGEVVQT